MYQKICANPNCNKQFATKKKVKKYCNRKCWQTSPQLAERMTSLNKSEAMRQFKRDHNPAACRQVQAKIRATKKRNGSLHMPPKNRGGNGEGAMTELTLALLLNSSTKIKWQRELPIPLAPHLPKGQKRAYTTSRGWPTCYKVDIANRQRKIAIEIDGGSHRGVRKIQDKKKDLALIQLGWKVLRVSKNDVINNPLKVLSRIKTWVGDTWNP